MNFYSILRFADVKLSRMFCRAPGSIMFPFLWVTDRCNLRCMMCDQWKTDPGAAGRELSTPEWKRCIDSLHALHSEVVSITGGEPLLRPDVYELIGYIRKRGMSCHLCTNGTLLQEQTIDRLAASGVDTVSISLDSVQADVHNRLRGVDCFDAVVRGVGLLRRRAPCVKIGINCMITRKNIEGIEAMIPFAQGIGADQIKFDVIHTHLMHRRKSIESFQGLLLGASDIDRLRRAVDRISAAAASSTVLTSSLTFIRGMGFMYFPGARRLPCYAGYHSCTINPYGFVSGCANHDGTTSIRQSPLEEIWRSPAFRQQRLNAMHCRERCWNSTYGELNIRCSLRHLPKEFRQVLREFNFYRSGGAA